MKILHTYILLTLIAAATSSFAQTNDCDQLRSEVEYLRGALKMQSNPVYTDVVMGVEVKILSITGSKRSRSFQMDALFTSSRTNKVGRFYDIQVAIDPEGNQYQTREYDYVNGVDLLAEVPVKVRMTFDNISPDIAFMKVLRLNFLVENQQKVVEYRNVKIDWK
jgi:hypothetical protein